VNIGYAGAGGYIVISERRMGAAMAQDENEAYKESNIWLRGVFMILLAMLYSLAGTVLFVVVVLQFTFVLLGSAPNARLLAFGRSLGSYVQQVVNYQTFNTEEKPFPFSDWPS
jgi:Flp pilus assembly protein TadB